MKKIKGQGAMEYLMTYGWALLVIVVVGAALFMLGVLNPVTYTQKRCQGFQYFTYQDQLAKGGGNGTFTIELINGFKEILVDSINITTGTQSWQNPLNAQLLVPSGERFVATINISNAPATGTAYSNVMFLVRYNATGGIPNNLDRATCSGVYHYA